MADYDESYPVIDKACAVAVAWNDENTSDINTKIAPYIYRNDYNTDEEDDTGYFHEVLEYEPDGTTGRWYDISAARWAGEDAVKLLDTFMPRNYPRRNEDYYVRLTINWHDWQSHGAWSGAGWHEFAFKVPKADKPKAPVEDKTVSEFATLKGQKNFVLRWLMPDNEASSSKAPSTFKNVIVQRKTNNDKWVTIATLAGSATTYTDTSTTQGNAYAYRICYTNGVLNSDYYPSANPNNVYTYPLKPSITEAKQGVKDNTNATVKWENGNAAANFETQTLFYSADGVKWTSVSIDSKQSRHYDFTDLDPSELYRFKLRLKSNLKDAGDEYVTVESDAYEMYTVPKAPTSVSHARKSDTLNTITWAYSGSENNLTHFAILRYVNGGSAVEVGSAAAIARTWDDADCRPDATYSYKVAAVNKVGYTVSAAASEMTSNTPSAPTIVSGYKTSDASVHLDLDNTSAAASETRIYMLRDGYTDWVNIFSDSVRITEADINVAGYTGTLYFKAQNVARAGDVELVSEFSNEKTVTDLSKPDHSITIEPADKAIVSPTRKGTSRLRKIRLKWQHVSTDGSPQEQAQISLRYYKTSEGAHQPQPIKQTIVVDGSDEYYDWLVERPQQFQLIMDAGSEVEWSVSTKGTGNEWSSSDGGETGVYSSFTVYDRPTPIVTIPNTDGNGNLLSFPVVVKVSGVTDLARFDVRIAKSATGMQSDAETILTKRGCTGSEAYITLDEFVPEANMDYFAFVVATDKHGFSNEDEVTAHFATKGERASEMSVTLDNDADNGKATLTMYQIQGTGAAPSRLVLVRISDAETVVMDVAADSAVFEDRYAPINVDYAYRLMAFSANGGVSVKEVANKVRSPWWFFMWGDDCARGKWDCQDPWSVKRPDKTRKYYAGRKDPVSYDTSAVSITRKAHFWVQTREEAMAFYRLVMDGGRCVYKSGDGFVSMVDVDGVDFTPTYRIDSWYGQVECDITKIAGGVL